MEIYKILMGCNHGKIFKINKKKFDLNGDGKVNMKDFGIAVKRFVDKNKDGHLSSEEVISEVVNIVTTIEQVEKM